MRVLITTDAVGGVWHYAVQLAQALLQLQIEPVLALIGPAPEARKAYVPDDVRLIETGLDLDWTISDPREFDDAGRQLERLGRREMIDLLHINQPVFAASRTGFPTLVAIHSCLATWWDAVRSGEPPASLYWQTDMVRRGLENADVIVAPSHSFAAAVTARYVPSRPIAVVPNGRAIAIPASNEPADIVFTASRLWDRAKNIAFLDRIAGAIAAPLLAAGSTSAPTGERIALSRVQTLGVLSEADLFAQLGARPIYVSAALYEPFGLSVLEAACAGCALVLSDIPSHRENWEDASVLVAPGDEDAFRRALSNLLADRPARLVLGAKAQRRAMRFTPEAMAGSIAGLYRDTVARAARSERVVA